jgi:hypothetical protein
LTATYPNDDSSRIYGSNVKRYGQRQYRCFPDAPARLLLAFLAFVVLGLGVCACGASGGASVTVTGYPNASASTSATSTRSLAPAAAGLMGDEDDDDEPGRRTKDNSHDNDVDYDNDVTGNRGTGYFDNDDGSVRDFGHDAGATDSRAISLLVIRYRSAAWNGDGRKAYQLLYGPLARIVPEDYGGSYSPAYARGKSCAVVMSKLFKHSHAQLAGTFHVTSVRVAGDQGDALLGSRTRPASYAEVRRERGAWKIHSLLGSGALP